MAFVRQYLLEEIAMMKAANVRLHLFIGMLQGIETTGALLDQKPFKAKGLGRKRFNLALRKLYPQIYSKTNDHLDLYGVLRSHSVHCMVPSHLVQLDTTSESHLTFKESVLCISLEQFYHDYHCSIEKLIGMIQEEKLQKKRIPLSSIELLNSGHSK